MTEPPPPYPETTVSEKHSRQRDPVNQFCRYLIEIMAFTFNADFAVLNRLLGQHTSPTSTSRSFTNSILTEDERSELLRLALLIRELHGNQRGHQWLTTRDSDRSAVADAIVKPALQVKLFPAYILKFISKYPDHQCDETKRHQTQVSRRVPRPLCIFRNTIFMSIYQDILHAHARMIRAAAPDEHIRMFLGNAMKIYVEEELGMKKISNKESGEKWPGWPHTLGSWFWLSRSLES